jgi:hypothetical protein
MQVLDVCWNSDITPDALISNITRLLQQTHLSVLNCGGFSARETLNHSLETTEAQQLELHRFSIHLSTNRFITTLDLNHVTLSNLAAITSLQALVDNRNVTFQNLKFYRIEQWDHSLLQLVPRLKGLRTLGLQDWCSLFAFEHHYAAAASSPSSTSVSRQY